MVGVVATVAIDAIGIRKMEVESKRIVKEPTCVDWRCLERLELEGDSL